MLKSIAFYRRSLEEYQETGCLWGEKLEHLGQGGREKKSMTLLLQPDYTVVSALKYMMAFCKQPSVDISVPFILKLDGRQMCVCVWFPWLGQVLTPPAICMFS